MRVLMAIHGFPPERTGGTEGYVLALCHALQDLGHEVLVLSGSIVGAGPDVWEPEVLVERVEGVPVRRVRRTGIYVDNWEKSLAPELGPVLDRLFDEFDPDLVHVHHWLRLTRALIESCHDRGVPAVCTLHDLVTTCPKAFRVRDGSFCELPLAPSNCLGCAPAGELLTEEEQARELELYREDHENELCLARCVIVPSSAHAQVIARHVPAVENRLTVVPHGRITPRFEGRATDKTGVEPLRIGHWGHISVLKGVDVLLEAVVGLEDPSRVHLELFGEIVQELDRPLIERLADSLDIRWHGAYVTADLASVPMDLAVIPSRARESWSFVLDETFALGLPVLVPDIGAPAERVQGAGATFRSGDPEDLRRLIRSVLDDPSRLVRWRSRIPELEPMSRHAERLVAIYSGVRSESRELPSTVRELRERRLAARSLLVEGRNREIELLHGRLANLRSDLERAGATMEEMHRYHLEKDMEIVRLTREIEALRRGGNGS